MANPEEELAALKAQNEEMKTQLAEAQKGSGDSSDELTRLREERAELIAGRDKAKQKAREAEEAKLAEQGEFKTLAEQKAAEAEALKVKLEELNGTISSYTERDEAKLQTLLADVPENLKGLIEKSSAPLAERLELAEQLMVTKEKGPGVRLPGDKGTANTINRQTFEGMGAFEKSEFCKSGGKVTD